MSDTLITHRDHGFDDKGYERRELLAAIAVCPKCGEEVHLWSETEVWTKGPDGRWHHKEYSGCSTGECCGDCIVSSFDEAFVIRGG